MNTGHLPISLRLVRALYTQNPFYLIGTLLVLFGLQQALGQEAGLAQSVLFVALLAGYTLLLAVLATVLIRAGQVWDDARTILLIIVLMFFMLSTSLDVHILADYHRGSLILLLGLLFAVAVSEGLLHALKLSLPAIYRGPYYLLLTLLFTYPIALARCSFDGYYTLLSWGLWTFPVLASLALLSLWPAAQGASQCRATRGTPWIWPYYPWSLFVFLTVGIGIRSWWLCVAFQGSSGDDAIFRPYFLLPLVFAWSVLVLEMGLARRSRGGIVAGLSLPLGSLLLVFPGSGQNALESAFLEQFTTRIGSPVQLAVLGLALFYVWAALRGIRSAEALLIGSLGLAGFIDAQTLDWHHFTAPQPAILGALVLGVMISGLILRTTWRIALGGSLLLLGMPAWLPQVSSVGLEFWAWHLPILGVLALGVLIRDDFAEVIRFVGGGVIRWLAVFAAVLYPWMWGDTPLLLTLLYLLALGVLSVAMWYRDRQLDQFVTILWVLLANVAGHLQQLYGALQGSLLAKGLPWLAAGLTIVAVAFAISLVKMGFWRRVQGWVARMNQVLGGVT